MIMKRKFFVIDFKMKNLFSVIKYEKDFKVMDKDVRNLSSVIF